MPAKRTHSSSTQIRSLAGRERYRASHTAAFGIITGNERPKGTMPAKGNASANRYLCAIEKNQSGKYDVRVRAVFSRDGWTLPVYFLASSFNAAMKKLEESLQLLQKNEEKLRFWGVERTDDPNLAGDLLKEIGLSRPPQRPSAQDRRAQRVAGKGGVFVDACICEAGAGGFAYRRPAGLCCGCRGLDQIHLSLNLAREPW